MKIENQKLRIKEAFNNNIYYIPDYQREYIWDEKNVGQLMDDIYEEYTTNSSSEYFIGSTVVTRYENKNDHYEVIDGQQRLTTLYIFLCAFKKLLSNSEQAIKLIEPSLASQELSETGDFVPTYKLNLQYADSVDIIQRIINDTVIESNLRDSSKRIYGAYKYAVEFINLNFDGEKEITKFLAYFLNSVNFIQIETPNISDALKTFETINERGVGLDPMDLLKNLIFRQVDRLDFKELNHQWKSIIDVLDRAKEKKLRFLRYFILSNYEVKDDKGKIGIREEDIYSWISKNESQCGYNRDPFGFVRNIKSAAEAYTNFANGKDIYGNKNIYLENIKFLGGASFSQHLILLMPTRDMEPENFDRLASNIETLIFFYTITRTQAKDLERKFSIWTKEINRIAKLDKEKETIELEKFINSNLKTEIKELEKLFDVGFNNLNINSLQIYKLRYILGKMAQFIDDMRIGRTTSCSLDDYVSSKIEIEHILPNSPTPELIDVIGNQEDYEIFKMKLGNLTLLEKPHNIVAGREFYEQKMPLYRQSKFYLTKSLVEMENVGSNTSVTRTNNFLKYFDHWGKSTIDQRQGLLHKLAKEIWVIR